MLSQKKIAETGSDTSEEMRCHIRGSVWLRVRALGLTVRIPKCVGRYRSATRHTFRTRVITVSTYPRQRSDGNHVPVVDRRFREAWVICHNMIFAEFGFHFISPGDAFAANRVEPIAG